MKVLNKDRAQKAISYAHRLFNVRPRSEKELRQRLYRRGFDRSTINSVISLFKEKNVIDDFKFARLWVESRMLTNPKGAMLLKKELRDKGVSTFIIEKVLSDKKGSEDSIARDLAMRKLESLKGLPKEKSRKKLFDFLARRGFNFDIIENIIDEVQRD